MADLTKDRLADTFRVARASQYSAPDSGGDALPIVYGDLTVPSRSTAGVYELPLIDTAGSGTYCIAGHAIAGSVSLFDRNGSISGSNYTLNLSNDFQGKGTIATAAFSVAPDGPVTAVCRGKENASSTLIENPVSIVEDLMVNVWGFAEQDIDQQALGRAFVATAGQGYAAAGVIEDDHAPSDVLTEILGDFLGRFEVDAFGRLRVSVAAVESDSLHPVKVLPALATVDVEAEVSRDSVINQVPVLYAADYAEGRHLQHDDGETTRGAASQVLYGTRTPSEGRITLDWVRSATVAQAVQTRIVERYRTPARILQISDSTFRALEVEPDDYVVFTVPWLRSSDLEPLRNQIGQVVTYASDLSEQTLDLRLRDTGFFLTAPCLADGSKTAGGTALAGGNRDTAAYA